MILVMEKKKIAQIGLITLLAVMVVCLWLLGQKEGRLRLVETPVTQPVLPTSGEVDPFTAVTAVPSEIVVEGNVLEDYRLERDKARSAQIELLRSAALDKALSAERRAQLHEELLRLMQKGEQEAQAEALLAARGYAAAVVIVTQSGATAVLPGVLTQEDAARIGELVARVCNVKQEKVTIMDAIGRN